MPEPPNIVVFLSTVSDEFGDYREKLRKTLTGPRVEVKIQEDFKGLGGVTLENLDKYIQACDIVVHLVGDMTGARPVGPQVGRIRGKHPDLATKFPPLAAALENGDPISYTQWEAWLALYHEKRLLIALADTDAERGPRHKRVKTQVNIQKAHLARLKAVGHHPSETFTNPDNLANRIVYPKIVDLVQTQPTTDRISGRDKFSAYRWAMIGVATIGIIVYLILVTMSSPTPTATANNENIHSPLPSIPMSDDEVHGWLKPANYPTPPNACDGILKDDAIRILIGNNAFALSGHRKMIVLKVGNCDSLVIERSPEGVFLDAELNDGAGLAPVRIRRNEIFAQNGETYIARQTRDLSSIVVKNRSGRSILDAKFLNNSTLKVKGMFVV